MNPFRTKKQIAKHLKFHIENLEKSLATAPGQRIKHHRKGAIAGLRMAVGLLEEKKTDECLG